MYPTGNIPPVQPGRPVQTVQRPVQSGSSTPASTAASTPRRVDEKVDERVRMQLMLPKRVVKWLGDNRSDMFPSAPAVAKRILIAQYESTKAKQQQPR